MFYRIIDDKLYDFGDYKYSMDCQETDIVTQQELAKNKNKVIVKDNELVLNPDFETEKLEELKELKLAEALEKAYEYENKTGFITFDGRPVPSSLRGVEAIKDEQDTDPSLSLRDISPRGERYTEKLSVELFNQGKFFQLVIGFAQGLLTDDFVYSTKEDAVVYINEQEAQGIYYAITEALSKLWTIDYPYVKEQITNCNTVDEIQRLIIDYAAEDIVSLAEPQENTILDEASDEPLQEETEPEENEPQENLETETIEEVEENDIDS